MDVVVAVGVGHEDVDVLAEHLLDRNAPERGAGLVGPEDLADGVDDDNGLVDVLELSEPVVGRLLDLPQGPDEELRLSVFELGHCQLH